VKVLIAGQNQDYKNAKVALCKFYSNNHCEGNNPFIALLLSPSIGEELKRRRHFIFENCPEISKKFFLINKLIGRFWPVLPVGSLELLSAFCGYAAILKSGLNGSKGSNSDFHNIAEQKEESAEAKSNLSPTVV